MDKTRSLRIFAGLSWNFSALPQNVVHRRQSLQAKENEMEASTFWWVAAAGLVIAELLTGTIYLLAIATGGVAGALAAHAGAGLTMQILIAAAVGTATTLLWHFSKARKNRASSVQANANADVNQDIGAQVMVDSWQADGTAQVQYRGAQWSVISSGAPQGTGLHRVTQVQGNRFVVEKI
jgi:membrane protein implicated in regulation of membrane protease activity